MSSRLTSKAKTAAALAAIGTDMDRVAAATPLGPWCEPVTRTYETPDQMRLRILDLIERLNTHNAPFLLKDAAE